MPLVGHEPGNNSHHGISAEESKLLFGLYGIVAGISPVQLLDINAVVDGHDPLQPHLMILLEMAGHALADSNHPIPPGREDPSAQPAFIKSVACCHHGNTGRFLNPKCHNLRHARVGVQNINFVFPDDSSDLWNRPINLGIQLAFGPDRKFKNSRPGGLEHCRASSAAGEDKSLYAVLSEGADQPQNISRDASDIQVGRQMQNLHFMNPLPASGKIL